MPRRFTDSVRRLLMVAAKVPQAGRVKTRLVSQTDGGISPDAAADLAHAFLRDTLDKAVSPVVPADVWLALNGDVGEMPAGVPAGGVRVVAQKGRELGDRLVRLFEQGFAAYDQILVLGSDTPHLPPAFLVDAWGRLKTGEADVVLGPAEDGGYYLVGLNAPQPGLFDNITWSTSAVLGETRERARSAGLRVAQTPPWYDIDTESDLRRLHTDLVRGVVSAPHSRAALAAALFH